MRDFGRSDDPRVQAQLDRLGQLSVPQGRLGLETITALLARLGDPHLRLPPVFHVAGTNGKGSTCAFLRAMLEAEGYKVHVTTSPHLVRYNERIRLAGELISDEALAEVLAEVLDAGEDLNPSFFEVTIAAAFLAFSRTPADACVVEVGMGGRFDATNVLTPVVLAACGIAALGLDHERFLLAPEDGVPTEPMARIAFEKAGIAKKGVPLVTIAQPELEMQAITVVAERIGAPLHIAQPLAENTLGLTGAHQVVNAGLAVALLRHQRAISVSTDAIRAGLAKAKWPARLQRLSDGPLTGGREVWLDGGHNPSAGEALARHFAGKKVHLVIGMIEGKDPASLIGPLGDSLASITAVPVPAHDWYPAEAFGPRAIAAPDVPAALATLPDDGLPVLIAGSLYLAGEVLRLNNQLPD
ncbi:bifunctional folylpolyglutamate synthase/dihydrofolate synthase [Altererythrobacter sp. BO-6]|uniref:bifunctional folylpolyglutamate synthase/dihydrofolate synthase n=1 Tax=Altererythrobacter sp. BO-6 TaxID=2604537 RepID=UPI0013E1D46A|nr:folylpolyglutamate synthase/dihydrofolate synthase family protein [Altererythrobacter sp. BO-6]QIG55200.1 bifunctional folylpolyglutamate synthase/dihydrofolate synthase [Altererythrobacter sp. BO-6]